VSEGGYEGLPVSDERMATLVARRHVRTQIMADRVQKRYPSRSPRPTRIESISLLERVTTSPAPIRSKKAWSCTIIAARYFSLTAPESFTPAVVTTVSSTRHVKAKLTAGQEDRE